MVTSIFSVMNNYKTYMLLSQALSIRVDYRMSLRTRPLVPHMLGSVKSIFTRLRLRMNIMIIEKEISTNLNENNFEALNNIGIVNKI